MRIKILNSQNEKRINKELEKLERENRILENVIPFKNKTWLLHYVDDESEEELKSVREDLQKLKGGEK